MTTGAETKTVIQCFNKPDCNCDNCRGKCKCCGNNKINDRNICLWCQKDSRKVALFNLCPHFCKYFASNIRFCRCCLKAIADEDDITAWIVNDGNPGTYVSPDGTEYDDDEFVAEYHQEEYEALYANLCECGEGSDGYWETEDYILDTLCLADVQTIESIRTKRKQKEMEKELAEEIAKAN